MKDFLNKKAEEVSKDFQSKRCKRVSKPHLTLVPENLARHLVFANNWMLRSDHASVMMDKPNDIALYSNIATSNLKDAMQIYEQKLFPNKRITLVSLQPNEHAIFYDYFEKITVSIIFAYSSIETLANIFIPFDFKIKKKEKSGVVKIWNKEAIERTYTLRDKLKVVLTNVLKTSEPEKEKWWVLFIELEEIRNELIHVKPSKSEERFSKLLTKKIFTIIETHQEIISYYGHYIEDMKSDSINKFPYGFKNDKVAFSTMSEKNYIEKWKRLLNIPK